MIWLIVNNRESGILSQLRANIKIKYKSTYRSIYINIWLIKKVFKNYIIPMDRTKNKRTSNLLCSGPIVDCEK